MMTQKEAIAYLGEDWEENFEEEVFAIKQQLLNVLPVNKLYHSKLKKWEKLEDAYLVLGGELNEIPPIYLEMPIFPVDVRAAFSLYNEKRNKLKLKLLSVFSFKNAERILFALISLETTFASLWLLDDIDETVVLSKIPDPMEIWSGIKSFESLGGKTFDDLKEMSNVVPETLKREQKRLTLYYTKYGKNE
jgi:hypothetical protein